MSASILHQYLPCFVGEVRLLTSGITSQRFLHRYPSLARLSRKIDEQGFVPEGRSTSNFFLSTVQRQTTNHRTTPVPTNYVESILQSLELNLAKQWLFVSLVLSIGAGWQLKKLHFSRYLPTICNDLMALYRSGKSVQPFSHPRVIKCRARPRSLVERFRFKVSRFGWQYVAGIRNEFPRGYSRVRSPGKWHGREILVYVRLARSRNRDSETCTYI